MDIAIALILVVAVAALYIVGAGISVIVLAGAGVAISVARLRRGRWQLAPTVLVFLLWVLASTIWWNETFPVWADVILVGLTVIALLIIYWSPIPHTPKPSGSFEVGLKQLDIPAQAHETENRLQVHLWYPAEVQSGTKPRFFFEREEAAVYSGSLKALGAPTFLQNHFKLAQTSSFENACAADGVFPLIVFNHGGAMWPTTNFSLMEELASHGHIVCSLAHPGESAGVLWQDGSSTMITADYIESLRNDGDSVSDLANFLLCQDRDEKRGFLSSLEATNRDTLTAATERWASRSIAVVDWLLGEGAREMTDGISSGIDPEKIIYCGMSLGGSVAHECCYLDPRAVAGINLDGMNWTFSRIDSDVPVPFLQLYNDPTVGGSEIAAKADPKFSEPEELSPRMLLGNDFYYESPQTVGSRKDVLRVLVPGTAHMAFTDLAMAASGPMRKLTGTGRAKGRHVTVAINELCRVFLTDVFEDRRFEKTRALIAGSEYFVAQVLDS